MNTSHGSGRGRSFLLRIIAAHLSGADSATFAKDELRRMQCEWCADSWPLLEGGKHNVMGVMVSCKAQEGKS